MNFIGIPTLMVDEDTSKDLEKALQAIEALSVWSIPKSPYVTELVSWRVYECKIKGREEPARHLMGYNEAGREGRVSSAVQKWEITDKGLLCVTKSGNQYLLRGHDGHSRDGLYVFGRWLDANGAKDVKDVTDQYYNQEEEKFTLPG